MTITIYGIKSCDTMKKAVAKLNELGVSYDFHDYKKQSINNASIDKAGIDKKSVQRWVDTLGIEKVLNKRSTTWRKLTDEQKQAADENVDNAIDLLVANTSMIKRPIVEGSYQDVAVLLCGFDKKGFERQFG